MTTMQFDWQWQRFAVARTHFTMTSYLVVLQVIYVFDCSHEKVMTVLIVVGRGGNGILISCFVLIQFL